MKISKQKGYYFIGGDIKEFDSTLNKSKVKHGVTLKLAPRNVSVCAVNHL